MVINHELLTERMADIFAARGVPRGEAELVAKDLVGANLSGVDSHGVLRIPQYLNEMDQGSIVTGAKVRVVKQTKTTAIVDCGHNFGQVGATFAAQLAADKAREMGVAAVITLHSNHIGRLGTYTEMIARAGLIGFGTAAVYTVGPMAPFGGREGRLGTNPVSYAVPRSGGEPIVMDAATTVVAEGKLRAYIQKGEDVPPGWIRDAEGRDTTDPMRFYGPPRGTILPMGGGAKGSALGLMADLFSVALANDDYWTCIEKGEPPSAQNGLFIMALNPDMFFGADAFAEQCEKHARFIKNTPPAAGFDEVLLPGELEQRTAARRAREGIELPDRTFFGLARIAMDLGLAWARGMDIPDEDTTFVAM